MKRFGRILVLTMSVIGLSLILGVATSHSVRAAVSALVTVANTPANPVPAQSVDAKNAFQANLQLGLSPQQITIPSGQRLVVDFITISGIADSTQGAIQPTIILESGLNGGGSANYYLDPAPSPVNIPGANQLYLAQPVKVYADSLTVSPAYSGFAPFTFIGSAQEFDEVPDWRGFQNLRVFGAVFDLAGSAAQRRTGCLDQCDRALPAQELHRPGLQSPRTVLF